MQRLMRILLIRILMNYKIHLKNWVIIITCFSFSFSFFFFGVVIQNYSLSKRKKRLLYCDTRKQWHHPNVKESKTFTFCVDFSTIDAKLTFVTPTYGTWCVQKGAHLKLGIVFLDFAGFLFWQTKWRDPQNTKTFTFFFGWLQYCWS